MTITSPITVTLNAVAKVLPRINNDGYGSHYRLVETLQRFDLKIRHNAEKPRKDGVIMDRHNVELTQTVFPVAGVSPEITLQAYVVLRNNNTNVANGLPYLTVALADLLKTSGFPADLVGWQN